MKRPVHVAGPDGHPHQYVVRYDGKTHTFAVMHAPTGRIVTRFILDPRGAAGLSKEAVEARSAWNRRGAIAEAEELFASQGTRGRLGPIPAHRRALAGFMRVPGGR